MHFANGIKYSPIPKQAFTWHGDLISGEHVAEFDYETHKPNNFYHINKNNLIKFGLVGRGSQIYFDVANGIFTINKHRFQISYVYDDTELPLTGRTYLYNDVITYKDAVSDAYPHIRGKGTFQNTITQFNVGYKKQMELFGCNINFQCIASIPIEREMFFQVKITSDKDLNGKLVIRRDGLVVDKIDAPLKAGLSGMIDWKLK
jgi:hypothetical protein